MPPVTLDSPVQYLKGVGPRRADQLAGLNICTVRDLIEHFPFRYGAQEPARPVADLVEGENATVIGPLPSAPSPRSHPGAARG